MKKVDYSYSSLEEYMEEIKLKEDGWKIKELNKNERYLKKLLTFETNQVGIKEVNTENHKSKPLDMEKQKLNFELNEPP